MNKLKTFFHNFKKNKKVQLIVLSLFIAFFVCGGIIASHVADINRLIKQENEYSEQLEEQKKENKTLESILESDDKDGYIEKKAREKGYVKSDEIVYYDISGSN